MESFTFPHVWKRHAVLMLISAGHENNKIAELLNVTRQFVWTVRQDLIASNYDFEAVAERKDHNRRSDTIRDREFIMQVQEMVNNDPSKSMRAMARDLDVSEHCIRSCLMEDIRYKSYRMRKGQLLTDKMKENRLKKSTRLLNKLKKPLEPGMVWIFSDEKNFCQDQLHNSQNNRWLAVCPKDVPRVMKTKYPATIMVFGVVTSEGDVMPPHIFPQGLRVNTEAYLEVLEAVVLPWIRETLGERPFVWQQDSAPCHTSRKSQRWLGDHFFDFTTPDVWPPNSPDLNPMDFFVWSAVEREANRTACNTKEQLISRIQASFASLPRDTVKRASQRFRGHIEAMIKAKGDFIE